MLLSISLILLLGMSLGFICKKCKLPPLLGMLLAGILIGPYGFNLLDTSILNISAEIRKIALIIILTRAGFGLDLADLKKMGRPAFLMCFVPATFELCGMLILGPRILGLTLLESAVTGAVLAAVSPAVVVPRMVRLTDEGYGTAQGIPQMILAGASVDDVFVIVLFSTFTGMMQGSSISVLKFVNIPFSIVLGIILGLAAGKIMALFFEKTEIRDVVKVIILLCFSFILVVIEDAITLPLSFSALIAIMFLGISLKKNSPEITQNLSSKYNSLWIGAEVFLFVLVGATVNINYLKNVGLNALIMIVLALLFRMVGVFVCLLGTKLNLGERFFTMMAYTPKATVQAAIGGIPLALGLSCGDITLTVAVLAIILTAPLGAFLIDSTYKKLLKKSE